MLQSARSCQCCQIYCGIREGCQRGLVFQTWCIRGPTQLTPPSCMLQVLNLSGRALEGQPRSSLGHVQASPACLPQL